MISNTIPVFFRRWEPLKGWGEHKRVVANFSALLFLISLPFLILQRLQKFRWEKIKDHLLDQLCQVPDRSEEHDLLVIWLVVCKYLELSQSYFKIPPRIPDNQNESIIAQWSEWIETHRKQIESIQGLRVFGRMPGLPPQIGDFNRLITLDLAGTCLEKISKEISLLVHLKSLDLCRNKLPAIPIQIWQLENLTLLNISWNQLTQLSEEIKNLKNLIVLKAQHNKLQELPKSIGELKHLTTLDLSSNQLREVPSQICQLSQLQVLNLSSNQLKMLPPLIGKLQKLQLLEIHHNQIKEIPIGTLSLSKDCRITWI